MNNRILSQLRNLPNINHLEDAEKLSLRRKADKHQKISVIYRDDITDEHDRQTVERITKEQLYGEKK